MELQGVKIAIISAGVNNWYAKGVERLERSLMFEGFAGNILTWKDVYPENCPSHEDVPYYIKIAAFEEAWKMGVTHCLWLDASFWCVRNPMAMFDIINEQGYYFFSSGYNLAQSANDNALAVAGLSRDEAENVIEWASGCVGININNPDGNALYYRWKELMDAGVSRGSRVHDNQSSDPRFLFHRQDQTCLSIAANELKLKNTKGLDMIAYKGSGHNINELIFFIQSL